MSFRFKFNLILGICFALFWLGSSVYFERQLEKLSSDAVGAEARLHMQASLAIREYTQEHVKPYVDAQDKDGFEAIGVPAFASRQTLDLLYRHYPGYRYREAVLNPTNPRDRAQGWEEALIAGYRKPGAPVAEGVEVITAEDGQSLHAVKPIRISKPACLRCHGAPETAPAAMRARYPGTGGFGWKQGEVVGAQIVTVPYQAHSARFQTMWHQFDLALLFIFGSLFVILNVLLEWVVLHPLQLNNSALNFLAETDALTKVANRRAFDRGLAREIALAQQHGQPLSLLLLDIDHFKRVNDQLGHAVGDDVLHRVAQELSCRFRAHDMFARLGGEEFVAMLPGLALDEAVRRADAARAQCAQLDCGIGRR